MSTSSEKDTTTTNKVDPWAPQAGALTNAFNQAGNVYNTASQATAPTDFVAQMSPEAIAAFRQMVSQGSNLGIPNTQANTANTLQGAGANGVTGALSGLGNYNASNANNTQSQIDAANKYVAGQDIDAQVRNSMLNATQTARDVTLPGIEQNAAIGGNTNSSRTGIAEGLVQRGLAQQASDLGATMRNNAFQTGLGLAQTTASNNNQQNLGALTSQGSIGNSAAGTGVTAGTNSVANQGALTSEMAAGGEGLTAAQQANLDNQYKQYLQASQGNYGALQGLMSIIGTNNWGSSSNGTSNTTTTPSAWDTISGLMSSGGGLMKGLGGMGLKF